MGKDRYFGDLLLAKWIKRMETLKQLERAQKSMQSYLLREGFASWRGGKPTGSHRPVKIEGKTVSEIVLEDRR